MHLVGYYYRSVQVFTRLTGPLTALTCKDHNFVCTKRYEKSFQELKKRLTTALVLTILLGPEGFQNYCDVSKQGLGTELMQHRKVAVYLTHDIEYTS